LIFFGEDIRPQAVWAILADTNKMLITIDIPSDAVLLFHYLVSVFENSIMKYVVYHQE